MLVVNLSVTNPLTCKANKQGSTELYAALGCHKINSKIKNKINFTKVH